MESAGTVCGTGPATTEQWIVAVETAESAAAVVQGLLARSEQRRLSLGS